MTLILNVKDVMKFHIGLKYSLLESITYRLSVIKMGQI